MKQAQRVEIFLEEGLLASARSGAHNFLNLLSETLSEAGHEVCYAPMSARRAARGKTITHMKPPASPGGLVFRRVYAYPFWQIEQTEKRWQWDTALASFDPSRMAGPQARRFQSFWRGRLFPGRAPGQGDTIYIPLQGKITEQRGFQSCRPIDMVGAVMAATSRPVIIGLHPKETYAQGDLAQLRQVAQGATIRIGGMEEVLPSCHAVVTMNSSAAFMGYFFDKPAHLFAQIDFHHIAQKKAPDALADALEHPDPRPYARYLHWFWRERSINAGRPEARAQIRARLARFGWV